MMSMVLKSREIILPYSKQKMEPYFLLLRHTYPPYNWIFYNGIFERLHLIKHQFFLKGIYLNSYKKIPSYTLHKCKFKCK